MEGAVTGIGNVAVGQHDLKEATPVDGHIERLFGGIEVALHKHLLRTHGAHPGTELQTRG